MSEKLKAAFRLWHSNRPSRAPAGADSFQHHFCQRAEHNFHAVAEEELPLLFEQLEHYRANLCRLANNLKDHRGWSFRSRDDVADRLFQIIETLPTEPRSRREQIRALEAELTRLRTDAEEG